MFKKYFYRNKLIVTIIYYVIFVVEVEATYNVKKKQEFDKSRIHEDTENNIHDKAILSSNHTSSLNNTKSLKPQDFSEGLNHPVTTNCQSKPPNLTPSWPKWLEETSGNNSSPKIRTKRRFLHFPQGSYVTTRLIFNIPLANVSDRSSMDLFQTSKWYLPTTNPYLEPLHGITTGLGRQMDHQRIHVFQDIQNALNKIGIDGKTCILKLVCDIADEPFHHGIVGELFNMLFTVSETPEDASIDEEYNDYLGAEYLGSRMGGCNHVYNCTLPILDLISVFA